MKKLLIVALFAASFLFFSANYSTAEDKQQFSVALDAAYYNRYVSGLSGGVIYDNPVFQQSVTLTHNPSGIYASVWNSYSPTDGANADSGDEVDYLIGLVEDVQGFTLDAGYAFYDLYKIGHAEGDLHAVYLNVDAPEIHSVIPYIQLEIDYPTDREILEGGVLYRAGVKYSIEIANQVIDLDLSIAGNDGAYGYKSDLVNSGKFGISTTFKVWKLQIKPEVNFQKRLGHPYVSAEEMEAAEEAEEEIAIGGIADNETWWGISISLPL